MREVVNGGQGRSSDACVTDAAVFFACVVIFGLCVLIAGVLGGN